MQPYSTWTIYKVKELWF